MRATATNALLNVVGPATPMTGLLALNVEMGLENRETNASVVPKALPSAPKLMPSFA